MTHTQGGLLVVDKPAGWTSHDVVARVRRLAATRRVGHAGTLDPMATGVLVLGVDRGTKLLTFLVGCDKSYAATIRLGVATLTDDAEGEITSSADASQVTREAVDTAVAKLTGAIMQVPSKVSAIKIDGKRSYARVRGGEEFEIPARPVTVSSFRVYDVREAVAEDGTPVLDLVVSVVCSSGTYIRAIARDLGAGLGVGGHLTALRRTRVGPFGVEGAASLDDLAATPLLAPAAVAAAVLGRFEVTAEEARDLRHGKRLAGAAERLEGAHSAAIDPAGVLVGIVERRGADVKSAMNMPEEQSR